MTAKGKQTVETAIVTLDQVERRIYIIRGNKVMLDSELHRFMVLKQEL